MRQRQRKSDEGPGVPEAVPRGLQHLLSHYGGAALDRIWIFPPMVSGRKEWGLLVASVFTEGPEPERRLLASLPYSAERTGKGLTLDRVLQEHGEAPPDRFPRMVDGVVRRAERDLGEPREVAVEGESANLLALLAEYDEGLLDPDLPPVRAEGEPRESETLQEVTP